MAQYTKLNNPNPESHRRAKELRRTSSPAEKIMWHQLRLASKGKAFRFRRQYPVDLYIVDFACLKFRLIVEIDGPSHDTRLVYDKNRDDYLRSLGYEVIRFTNEDVLTNSEGVILEIMKRIEELEYLSLE